MHNLRPHTYTKAEASARPYPNGWDILAIGLVFSVLAMLGWGAVQMHSPYAMGEPIAISLEPTALPHYALRSVLRMLLAMCFSLLATFIFGTWAAKSRRAERLIIPLVDVLQAVPILSFLSLSLVAFIALFPGSLLGPECCAIFAIFTSQAWNMILSFYQSLSATPGTLRDAADVFQLSAWQRFWRVEVPFAMPGLLWNMMLSMSGSWFFVVASEAISIANQHITLPGIGSYIGLAINQKNSHAIYWAIGAMATVIIIYDQLLFRPLDMWISKFKAHNNEDDRARPWLASLFHRSHWLQILVGCFGNLTDQLVTAWPTKTQTQAAHQAKRWTRHTHHLSLGLQCLVIAALLAWAAHFLWQHAAWPEIRHVLLLGLYTGLRVMVMIAMAALLWLPIGVWIGLRPRWRRWAAPIAQLLAAFPSNLLFPVAVVLIVRYNLNPNTWCAPLMVLGTQWYILFNVIAGASELPKDLNHVAQNFGLRGWLWWQKLILPGIFPYFLTGLITAAGGAWNASVVAETISWGAQRLHISGLGHYIETHSSTGNYHRVMLGTLIMCLYVLLINRTLWRPLYQWAEERFAGVSP